MNKQYEVVNVGAVGKGISWCTHTASPIKFRDKLTGKGPLWSCVKVSSGCQNCYAESLARRFQKRSFTVADAAKVEPYVDEKELKVILGMNVKGPYPAPHTRPAVFIEDMSDLWGDWVPFEMIDRVMSVAALRPDIAFQFLTKRAERMVEYFERTARSEHLEDAMRMVMLGFDRNAVAMREFFLFIDQPKRAKKPLPNVLLGFSSEDQPNFDARWADMRKLAAMGWKVFCSYEPALGLIDFGRDDRDGNGVAIGRSFLDLGAWLIPGGESGRSARPFDVAWMRSAIAQCSAAGIALWAKQMGANPVDDEYPVKFKNSHGGDWLEWDEGLRVRQLPAMS